MSEGQHLAYGQTRPKNSYDAEFKQFLGNKGIIAYIAKDRIKEYSGLSVEEICTLIEGEPIVGKAKIKPGETNASIAGLNTESLIPEEGKANFDVLTFIRSRDGNERNAIVLNLEAQYDPEHTYPLGQRSIYYAARNISAQKDRGLVGFLGKDYGNLHKVYSIWIIPDRRQDSESFISSISFALHGDKRILDRYNFEYDFIEIIYVNVGQDWFKSYNSVIGMIGVYLSDRPKEWKIKHLEEDFGVTHSKELEGLIDNMDGINEFFMEQLIERFETKVKDKVAKEIREEVTKDITDKVTKDVTDKVTKDVTDKVTKDVTDKVTKDVTDKVTKDVTDKVTMEKELSSIKAVMDSLNLNFEVAYRILKYPEEDKERLLTLIGKN